MTKHEGQAIQMKTIYLILVLLKIFRLVHFISSDFQDEERQIIVIVIPIL